MTRTLIGAAVLGVLVMTSGAEERPEDILAQLFSSCSTGKTNEALRFFAVTNEVQREKAIELIRHNMLQKETVIQPIRSFTDADCALVGSLVICTNADAPSCTAGFTWMIRTKEGWRMEAANTRTPQQREAFQRLIDGIEPFERELYDLQKKRDADIKVEARSKLLPSTSKDNISPNHTSDSIRQPADGSPKPSR